MSTKKYTNDLCGCGDCPECGVSDESGWARFEMSPRDKRAMIGLALFFLLFLCAGFLVNIVFENPVDHMNMMYMGAIFASIALGIYLSLVLFFSDTDSYGS